MHCGCVFASQTVSSLLPFEIKTYASKLRASSAQLPRTQIQINPSDDLSIYGSDKSPANRVSLPSHVNSITSTTNPFVKHCLKLRQSSSYRHAHGSVLVVGTIPIRYVSVILYSLFFFIATERIVESSFLFYCVRLISCEIEFQGDNFKGVVHREVCMFQTNKQGMTTEIECLLLHEEAKIPQGLESLSIRIVRVSSLVMKKLSGVQSTESVEAIALMRIPSSFTDLKDDKDIITDCNKWFPSAHRVLVLDSIQV